MFNTIKLGDSNQTVNFNATSTGHLQKSHPKSRFIRFQKGSDLEKRVFPVYSNTHSHIVNLDNDREEVTVLQTLVFGNDNFLCEIIENKDIK